ncbi:Hypothetical predicted protein, partial [Paramuricea clavata]
MFLRLEKNYLVKGLNPDSSLAQKAQAKKVGRQFFPGCAPRRFQGRFRGGRGQSAQASSIQCEGTTSHSTTSEYPKRVGAQASYKPEGPKQFCTSQAFQNGINTHVKISFKKRRLFRENRLKGCIPDSTCLERPPEVPLISLEGLTYGVCMPSIRPCERSKSVHKAYETSPVSFATERHSTHSLRRRLSYNGRISTTCPTACGNSTKSIRGTGVCSKLSKVTVNTIPTDRMTSSLPKDKINKVLQNCQQLLDNPVTPVWELSKFLGLLSSSIQAVFPAPLHYRYLQQVKNFVLKRQESYKALVNLDSEALQE